MCVQGVSTRRVQAVTEQLCGLEISSVSVSCLTAELDEELPAWLDEAAPDDFAVFDVPPPSPGWASRATLFRPTCTAGSRSTAWSGSATRRSTRG